MAPSRVKMSRLPSAVVIMSFIDRELATIESVMTGPAGVADVDGVDPVATDRRPRYRCLPSRVKPDFTRVERGPRQASDDIGIPPDVSIGEGDDHFRAVRAQVGGDDIGPWYVPDKRTVVGDGTVAGGKTPSRRQARYALATSVARVDGKANDVALPHGHGGRRHAHRETTRGNDLNRATFAGCSRPCRDGDGPWRDRGHLTADARSIAGLELLQVTTSPSRSSPVAVNTRARRVKSLPSFEPGYRRFNRYASRRAREQLDLDALGGMGRRPEPWRG